MNAITQQQIDQQVFDLYDEYCHGGMDRREFLRRASALGALSFALSLLPDYARAQTISFTDPRIKARYVNYASPGGNPGPMMIGYLVQPVGEGPFPAVLVVHENRGLNPYIQDVARRVAVQHSHFTIHGRAETGLEELAQEPDCRLVKLMVPGDVVLSVDTSSDSVSFSAAV